MGGSVAEVGVLVLLALLLQKELASAAQAHRYHSLSQALNLGIAPMQISRVWRRFAITSAALGGTLVLAHAVIQFFRSAGWLADTDLLLHPDNLVALGGILLDCVL